MVGFIHPNYCLQARPDLWRVNTPPSFLLSPQRFSSLTQDIQKLPVDENLVAILAGDFPDDAQFLQQRKIPERGRKGHARRFCNARRCRDWSIL